MSTSSRNTGKITQATREKLREAKEFAQKIVDNPEYRTSLLRRAILGQLPAAVELRLLEYRYGKPAEQPMTAGLPDTNVPLEELSEDQLADMAEQLARNIRRERRFAVVAGSDKVM